MAKHRPPRPGFVLDVDKSTPPILFHHGDGFRLERLPAGRSRVCTPAEPLPGSGRSRRLDPQRVCCTRSTTIPCPRCCARA